MFYNEWNLCTIRPDRRDETVVFYSNKLQYAIFNNIFCTPRIPLLVCNVFIHFPFSSLMDSSSSAYFHSSLLFPASMFFLACFRFLLLLLSFAFVLSVHLLSQWYRFLLPAGKSASNISNEVNHVLLVHFNEKIERDELRAHFNIGVLYL